MSPSQPLSASERARRAITTRPRRALSAARRAAILVPVIEDDAPPRLLLTRRTETLSSHRGQVAFPGGNVDPEDADEIYAALREAHEEVGLPASHVEVLGLLDDLPTVTGTTIVTPVLGWVWRLPELRAAPAEVARVFTIPLDALRDPAGWEVRDHEWQGQRWPVYFFPYADETLWGLSALVALQALALIDGEAPHPLPKKLRQL